MKHGDDVRRKRDQSVVQIFQHKTEDEPEWKVVPADQSAQVMAIVCVIPQAAGVAGWVSSDWRKIHELLSAP